MPTVSDNRVLIAGVVIAVVVVVVSVGICLSRATKKSAHKRLIDEQHARAKEEMRLGIGLARISPRRSSMGSEDGHERVGEAVQRVTTPPPIYSSKAVEDGVIR